MALPNGQQYYESVQNPLVSFVDPELKSAKVETDLLGLPKPYSGGFTVTFRLQSMTNSWAVRCMIKDVSELQRRYQTITDFFSSRSCKYFIDARYLQNGIRVNGSFYPIIKMKWMDGEPINIYFSKNFNNKLKVETILNDFQNLISELEALGIAHGDLQQGNIIVKNDRLYLIDYDGMYLPALNGLQSNELGHPNFQHPQRAANHFNEKIDRFSSIVIYLSLRGLIYKPALWNKYHNSDNLLLRSQDIGDLAKSALIADLNTIPEIKLLVERFIGICHLNFDKIPSLKEFIAGNFIYDKNDINKLIVKGSQYDILDAKIRSSILEHFGERVEVIGFISDSYNGRTTTGTPCYFLNVGHYPNQTFTVTVWSEGILALKLAGKSPSSLTKKWISIIGTITTYRGRPQIVAESASQIQILSSEHEAQERLKLKKVSVIYPINSETHRRSSRRTSLGEKLLEKSKTEDKEAQVFGELYKNMQASTPTTPNPVAKPKPVQTTTKPYSTPPQPVKHASTTSSSTSPSKDNSCTVALIFAGIGGIIGAAISESGGGFIAGAIVGFIIYSAFSKE